MKHGIMNSRRSGFHRQIADILRREPRIIRILANRLRAEIVKAGSSHSMDTAYMEWYAILTLWPKSEIIKLLEDPGEEELLRQLSPIFALLTPAEGTGFSQVGFSTPQTAVD